MRIAMLADTHVNTIEDLPQKIIDALSDLEALGNVKAVQGNMDSSELKAMLPAKEIVEIKNKRIGITHGSGSPWGIEERVRKVFESDQIDILVYGHSHQSQNKVIKDILFLNPGKAMDSFGILTIDGETKGEIISSK